MDWTNRFWSIIVHILIGCVQFSGWYGFKHFEIRLVYLYTFTMWLVDGLAEFRCLSTFMIFHLTGDTRLAFGFYHFSESVRRYEGTETQQLWETPYSHHRHLCCWFHQKWVQIWSPRLLTFRFVIESHILKSLPFELESFQFAERVCAEVMSMGFGKWIDRTFTCDAFNADRFGIDGFRERWANSMRAIWSADGWRSENFVEQEYLKAWR